MPCIQTMYSGAISPEKEKALKARFGKAISLLPGKSEAWLMLTFTDRCRIWFQGNREEESAFVEVKLFGGAGRPACDSLTRELTAILHEELGVRPDRVYIKYEPVENWGWNGSNL